MIRSEYRADALPQNRGASGLALQRVIWIISMVCLGMLLAYKLLPWSNGRQTSPELSQVETRGEGGRELAGQQADVQRVVPPTPLAGQRHSSVTTATAGSGSTERVSQGLEGSRTAARDPRQSKPAPSYSKAKQLMTSIAQMSPRHAKWSREEIDEFNRLIQDLKGQGLAGIMAIREFLESGQDVSFAPFIGRIPLEYSSLRVAIIDALTQMGGPEATDFMTSMLHATKNPEEIAFLAKGLEQAAPGAYRAEILNIARTMLNQAFNAPPGQNPGLGHLFGMVQDYGDASFAVDLENMFRKSPSTLTEYELIALSKLPEGCGIPSLLRMVNEMSENPGAYGMTYDTALRYLTQASREYPEAGAALLSLATANKISTSGLIQVARALGGMENQLITKSSGISSRSEMGVAWTIERWTDAQIDQRLALVDQLLRLNTQPAAIKALQDARKSLLTWKDRPLS